MKKLVLFLFSALLVGCGGTKLAEVSGTVTYKGKPLPTGKITFVPDDGSRQATGDIVNGEIKEVTTFKTGDGVVSGKCKVLIHAYKNPDAMENLQSIIPSKYGNPKETPLSAEIKSGPNQLSFQLD